MDRLVQAVEKYPEFKGLEKGKDIDFIDGFPNHVITTEGRIIALSYEDLNRRTETGIKRWYVTDNVLSSVGY